MKSFSYAIDFSKVELKNSVGKNKTKRDTKNIINDQKSPSPDQVTNELFSSFNEIKF